MLSLAGAAAACGSVKKDEQPDAAVDAPLPPRPVKLTALSTAGDGVPDPSAIAVFVDPAGAVIKDGMVTDEGLAEAMMPDGGTVHVIRVTESATLRSVLIQTFTGVKPGDELTGGLRRRPTFRTGATTVMSGTFSSTGTAFSYSFINDCGSTSAVDPGAAGAVGTIPAVNFRESCHDADVKMLAVATPSVAGANPRFVFTTFAHASGGSFIVPNAWQTMPNFSLSVSNVAEEVTGLLASRATYLNDSGVISARQSTSITGDPPAGNASLSLPYPVGVGPRALVQVSLIRSGMATQEIAVRTANVAAALTVDAAELPLPWVSPLTATGTSVTWMEEGAGTPDLRLVTWSGRFTTDIATSVGWLYGDNGGGGPSLTLPALPPAYAAYDPTQQASTVSNVQLYLIDRSDLAGYDQTRPNLYEYLFNLDNTGLDADVPYRQRRTISSGR